MSTVAPLLCRFLGRVPYAEATALQEALRRRILGGEPEAETLLLCEHDPVITLGVRAHEDNIRATPELLAARGVTLSRASRGGDVTYHGPGQLVAYPVIRLGRGVLAHVEALAAAAVAVAASVGVAARFRRDCPGVWVGDDKLASIGVNVQRRVAIHGLALNAHTALDAFDLIVPCGLSGTRTTSLAARAAAVPPLGTLAQRYAEAFAAAVGRRAEFAHADAREPLLSRAPLVE